MQYAVLRKQDLNAFIQSLRKSRKVVAPVRKGEKFFAFEEVSSADQVALNYIPTLLPPKKYFMPQYETLIEYDTKEGQVMEAVVEYDPTLLFAVHTCDLAGIQCLNVVFSDRPKDYNYLIRKNTIPIIGFECNTVCDEYSTCAFMGNAIPNGGYDLFLTDLGEDFLVHVNTVEGEKMIADARVFSEADRNHIRLLEQMRENKKNVFRNRFGVDHREIPEMFKHSFESQIWEEIGNRCLSCGNCTNVCPTCYCFDVMDESNLDLKTGRRIRVWDSCQNESFARVATGENFREKRSDRKRHRFYRKFKYPVDRYGRFFCTGCGRCTRTCMAKISLIDTVNAIIAENRKGA